MDWKLSYDLIKPTEEETCNSYILKIYKTLSRFSTIPMIIKWIGYWECKCDEDWQWDAEEYLSRVYHTLIDIAKVDKIFVK